MDTSSVATVLLASIPNMFPKKREFTKQNFRNLRISLRTPFFYQTE